MESGSFGNNDLEEYLLNHSSAEDKLLYDLRRHTHLTAIHPRMVSGPIQGKFLELICRMLQPQRVLEIGTYTGYSAISMARVLPHNAKLHTIEINDEVCDVSLAYFEKAGLMNTIVLHQGSALDVIPNIHETFDLIHIDGDKREYPEYLNIVLPKLRTGGVILADNVLWGGKVLLEKPDNDYTRGVMEFNRMVAQNTLLEKVILPFRDGLTLIYKLG